jgi:hypothetical protein
LSFTSAVRDNEIIGKGRLLSDIQQHDFFSFLIFQSLYDGVS